MISAAEASTSAKYVIANNEGEATAIAVGMRLAGVQSAVIMQNSGLGNAVNPLTSLAQTLRVPVLILVTWRGRPGSPDEPQHELMGKITRPMLDSMRIVNELMPDDPAALQVLLARARDHMARTGTPFAIVVPKGSVGPFVPCSHPGAASEANATGHANHVDQAERGAARPLARAEAIAAVVTATPADAVIVATTGKTARELEAGHDRDGNLYVVGSMGCASSVALGVALEQVHRRVVILDGDGAALMRLEALASIGRIRPPNLCHLVLDNAAYDSTGAQLTGSPEIDFSAVALACGYDDAGDLRASTVAGLKRMVTSAVANDVATFRRIWIRGGSDPDLGRPQLDPPESALRFEKFLAT